MSHLHSRLFWSLRISHILMQTSSVIEQSRVDLTQLMWWDLDLNLFLFSSVY
jgi:hypothetical protein